MVYAADPTIGPPSAPVDDHQLSNDAVADFTPIVLVDDNPMCW